GPVTRGLLSSDPALAARFAGPSVGVVADLARVLVEGGWEVNRVLRGPTRREMSAHPALETLAPSMGGLWRLLVRQREGEGTRNGEGWFLADLPPEARAGVPLLLLEDWERAIVAPVDPDLLAWWRSISGPELLGWPPEGADTSAEARSLLAAVSSFAVRA